MPTSFLAPLSGNGSCSDPEPSSSVYHPIYLMDFDPTLFEISAPKGDHLGPPPSSHSIETSSYELHHGFIAMVWEQSFSGDMDESPYSHLREFEQFCSCLVIAGMSQDTLKWKLFPFSLTGRTKQWYSLNVRSMEGDWESLRKAFCLTFFSTPQVVKLWREVICFEQRKNESLGAAWARFMKTTDSGPDLGITEPILLQHFRDGLGPESEVFLDSFSGGSFAHLTLSKCKGILTKILQIPLTREFMMNSRMRKRSLKKSTCQTLSQNQNP
jgi:hypothetical protein